MKNYNDEFETRVMVAGQMNGNRLSSLLGNESIDNLTKTLNEKQYIEFLKNSLGLAAFKMNMVNGTNYILMSKPKFDRENVDKLPHLDDESIVYFAYLYDNKNLLDAFYYYKGTRDGVVWDSNDKSHKLL